MRVISFGVRDNEFEIHEALIKKYDFKEVVLEKELLTHENVEKVKGFDAVMLRVNCVADKVNLDKFKEFGVKYIATRSAGTNHIDLKYAASIGYKVGYVPFYSPNAISEWAVSAGCSLMRNLFTTANQTGTQRDFRVLPEMFSKEIRFSTIGVIGTGRIGYEVAKAYKGIGAKVIGYDLYPSEKAKEVLEYVELDQLLKEADLVSLHCPYIPGENEHMVNEAFLAKMKNEAFLVNGARGEIVDPLALYNAIKNNKLKGAVTDVVEKEAQIFNKKFGSDPIPVSEYEKLNSLYPKVVITPHIAAFTDEAVRNMIDFAYEDLVELEKTGSCKNSAN